MCRRNCAGAGVRASDGGGADHHEADQVEVLLVLINTQSIGIFYSVAKVGKV
jgi:hypothetical protein